MNLPCFSYSSKDELQELFNRLLKNGKPTDEYFEMMFKQREWLIKNGTTEARALSIIKTMMENKK